MKTACDNVAGSRIANCLILQERVRDAPRALPTANVQKMVEPTDRQSRRNPFDSICCERSVAFCERRLSRILTGKVHGWRGSS